MTVAVQSTFEDYLVSIGAMASGFSAGNTGRRKSGYRSVLEQSSLEQAAFAEAVATFHKMPRTSLTAMRAGRPLIDRFSTRFLTEFSVFPYEARLVGLHGSLTSAEMLIPILVA